MSRNTFPTARVAGLCCLLALAACLVTGRTSMAAPAADQPEPADAGKDDAAEPRPQAQPEEEPRVPAPDFKRSADSETPDAPLEWLNTEKPISIKDLKGQVVLLDFWTYCCINCMHIFPDLKFLEEKYKDQPFVVIGVHSGKFDQEKDPEHIRAAILRHNIAHPVVVDSDFDVWKEYGVRAWPTLVLIDPEGNVIGGVSGEGHREVLDQVIEKVLATHRDKGTLGKPMKFRTERETFEQAHAGALEFPGKVLADAAGKRLFISDTNHHRVLVADLDGKVSDVIGAGEIGLADGPYARAKFHQPQGLALSADGKTLYVADTENHAVRAVDLAGKAVTTLAGTGEQTYERAAHGAARETALSSPWDLALTGEKLYVAMAGLHQLWVIDLAKGTASVFAGTGAESARDGPNWVDNELERSGAGATFSQPSGLASDGEHLYVADSEVSSVRKVELKPDGRTALLAGSAGLFDFGLMDGKGKDARFQHCLGVALYGADQLFVADTFNHVIRLVDTKTGETKTWLGTGKSDPGEATAEKIGFYEPGGLSVAGETLYVADTNHHRVVAVDVKSKKPRVLDVKLPEAEK